MNTRSISCPHCGAELDVEPDAGAEALTCPQCSGPFSPEPIEEGDPDYSDVAPTEKLSSGDSLPRDTVMPTIALACAQDDAGESSPRSVGEFLAKARGGRKLRYAEEQEIAHGGMGAIHRVLDADIGRKVAKKILRAEEVSSEQVIRFIEEAQVTGQLEHPNIVPVHEIGMDRDERAYFTMKLVKGRSLEEILEDQKSVGEREYGSMGEKTPTRPHAHTPIPSLSELLSVFLKVCDAMAFAHSRGVIHRDLKPANIMVGEFGEVLVMDWGLAKVVGVPDRVSPDVVHSVRSEQDVGSTREGEVQGTLPYMPPEQAEGALEKMGPRSDVYSLGAILYQMLCLVPPVQGKTFTELLVKIADGKIDVPERRSPDREIPRELSAIAMKALSTKIEDRYQSVTELAGDVRLHLEGRAVSAKDDSLLEALVKLVRRNKEIFATAAIAAGLLLWLGVYSFTRIVAEKDAALRARQDAESAQDRAELNAKAAIEERNRAEESQEAAESAKAELLRSAMAVSKQFSEQALELVDQGRIQEAEARASDALEICRTAPYGWYAKAMAAQADRRHPEALQLFETALQHDPTHADSRLARTRSQAELGRLGGKKDDIFESDMLTDDEEKGSEGLSTAAEGLSDDLRDRLDEALGPEREKEKKEEAEPIKGRDWRALVAYAGVAASFGKHTEALAYYGRALQLMETAEVALYERENVRQAAKRTRVRQAFGAWLPERDRLVGEEKARAVVAKLEELNGETVECTYERDGAKLTAFRIHDGRGLTDLSPLSRLELSILELRHCPKLSDLSPLKEVPLRRLVIENCPSIADYSVLESTALESLCLAGQPFGNLEVLQRLSLKELDCSSTDVTDLWPLKGLKRLVRLNIRSTSVRSLAPLEGLPLEELDCRDTDVMDLSPLEGVPLKRLLCDGTLVRSLEPLKGMSLEELSVNGTQILDLDVVSSLKSLKSLHFNSTAAWDLEPLRGSKLTELSFDDTTVEDLRPLEGLRLERLSGNQSLIESLEPLRRMPLVSLSVQDTYVVDLRPLEELKTLRHLDLSKNLVADLTPLQGLQLTALILDETRVRKLDSLSGLPLTELSLRKCQVDSLSPLAEMPLEKLALDGTRVGDFEALRKLRGLWELSLGGTEVRSLAPLEGLLRLKRLALNDTAVSDLRPLQGLRLKDLDLSRTPITDLAPLQGMSLERLVCEKTGIQSLEPLRGMPLRELSFKASQGPKDLSPLEGSRTLRSLHVPEGVTDLKPLADLGLRELYLDSCPVTDLGPLRDLPLKTLSLPGGKLVDLSPLAGAPIRTLHLGAEPETNFGPLHGLPNLRVLHLSAPGLEDASPLKGLKLWELHAKAAKLKNIEPLHGMPLKVLTLQAGSVNDLGSLRGMPLRELDLSYAVVKDLGPLRGMMSLRRLVLGGGLTDLSSLEGLSLVTLSCLRTRVTDLSPLKGMRLRFFHWGCRGYSDLPPLKGHPKVLSPLKGMPLKDLFMDCTPVGDLSPLRGMRMTVLMIGGSKELRDLHGVEGMPLTRLDCWFTEVDSLEPLRGMRLKSLFGGTSRLSDLGPLAGMPLVSLSCGQTRVSDLTPLRGMPLKALYLSETPNLTDLAPLEGLELERLIFTPKNIKSGIEVVRRMKSLTGIGDLQQRLLDPAAFWKKYDAGEFR